MLYERIRELCKQRGITVAKLEQDLELGRSSVRKFDQHDPGVGKINMIAGYLGVSVDYLLGDDYYLNGETARMAQQMYDDPDMRALFHMKRNMNPERFKAHKKMMADMYRLEHPEDDYDLGD